jgi:death-on-curing protein
MTQNVWRWISEAVVLAIHDAQIAEHGGASGVRDLGLIQSALGRVQTLAAYATPDSADLAAAYAFGLVQNHGFVDGNKRTGFVVALVFLLDHGHILTASDAECVETMLALAAGDLPEHEFAVWLRAHTLPAE